MTKPRIGITQRVIRFESIDEVRDSLDQRWAQLLNAIGMIAVPIPNFVDNPSEYCSDLGIDGVILSGGDNLEQYSTEGTANAERDDVERELIDFCSRSNLPLLGVCRGFQALVHHFGGSLSSVKGHVATRHTVEYDDSAFDLGEFPNTVNSYHELGIQKSQLPSKFRAFVIASDETVEGASTEDGGMVGIMWHPEREPEPTKWDLQLLSTLFAQVEK